MAEELLVPLKKFARVHEMIPYIEKISQPGMKVIFLLPFTAAHLNCWRDRRISLEADIQIRLAAGLPPRGLWQYRETLETDLPRCEYSWESEKRRYEEKLFPLCERLRQMGSKVAVNLYNRGDLRNVLRSYWLSGDRRVIITSCSIGFRLKAVLCRKLSILGLSNALTYSPALLLSTHSCP